MKYRYSIIFAFILLLPLLTADSYATILLKEVVGPDQKTEFVDENDCCSKFVASNKNHKVGLMLDSIMVKPDEFIKLKIGFYNLGKSPLEVGIHTLSVYSAGKRLTFLTEKDLENEVRNKYLKSKTALTSEQQKALAPLINEKTRLLKQDLLIRKIIQPDENYWGFIALKSPSGEKELTVEALLAGETHSFKINIVKLN